MHWVDRTVFAAIVFGVVVYITWAAPRFLDPTAHDPVKQDRDRRWVNTSPYFIDRQACRWLSLCGLHHLRADPANRDRRKFVGELGWLQAPTPDIGSHNGNDDTKSEPPTTRDVPDYVLRHAPLVHLYSGEQFWPSDIRNHISHMDVQLNTTVLKKAGSWDLDNMHQMNKLNGSVFMHSKTDVEKRPRWLHSRYNIPAPFPSETKPGLEPAALQDIASTTATTAPHHPHAKPSDYDQYQSPAIYMQTGKSQKVLYGTAKYEQQQRENMAAALGHKPDAQGYSAAPATLVLVDKGDGVLDAFWFFFYSYNLGQTVLTMRFGNHIGDWEHCMVRFQDGVPQGMFLSEHEGGQAYAWEAMEKRNMTFKGDAEASERPVIYSAVGSHAMYATPGDHPYILPFNMLKDVTDEGPLWDPSLNNYAYHYDYASDDDDQPDNTLSATSRMHRNDDGDESPRSLTPASSTPWAPTSWFHFRGRWGDGVYPLADVRQWRLFGQYHYVAGPQGPKFKNLGRTKMCPAEKCRIRHERDGSGTWY